MNKKDIETILYRGNAILNCSSQIQGPVNLARKGALGLGRENTSPDLKILKGILPFLSTESKTRL